MDSSKINTDYSQSELIVAAKNGDTDAFGKLYSLYSADLYRFALYNLSNVQDAEDAVQDAVTDVYKSISRLKSNELFKAYLFKCLSNRCKQKYKQRKKSDTEPIEDWVNSIADDETLTQSIEIYERLKSLNENEKQIVLLSVFAGYSSIEIAKTLHKPSATIRSTLARALKKLEKIELKSENL